MQFLCGQVGGKEEVIIFGKDLDHLFVSKKS